MLLTYSSIVSTVPDASILIAETERFVHDESTVFIALIILALIIFLTSKIGEEICAWLKLPPILGQLLGGLILGVSALHILVFPENDSYAINPAIIQLIQWIADIDNADATFAYTNQLIAISEGAANLGVLALLFLIGLESDFDDLLKVGPQAIIVATAGVFAPFGLGTLGLTTLFGLAAVPAIFASAALTATSIGITAKVLQELNQLKSKSGQIIIGAAIFDDVLGILVLAVVISLAKSGSVDMGNLAILLLSTTLFVGGIIALHKPLAAAFMAVTSRLATDSGLLIAGVIFALLFAGIAHAIHLEAILGAFAAGIVLGGTDKSHSLREQFQPIVELVAPIFFVVIGAKTDLTALNPANPDSYEGLAIALFLIIVAILGKGLAGYCLFGDSQLNRLAIGIGMIPRGEVGLVFAGIGTSLNVFSESVSAAVVLMVIFTTFITPILLRGVMNERQISREIATDQI